MQNFRQDRFKYAPENQTDIYNPEFNSSVKAVSDEENLSFKENLDKYAYFYAYILWNPDTFLDIMTPKDSKRKLKLFQRVELRAMFRFMNNYFVLSRGSAKSFTELLGNYLMCVLIPNIRISLTAETKDQAIKIIKDKHKELLEWYPFFEGELKKVTINTDTAEIIFQNGSVLDVIPAQQTSKGLRRHRMNIEESARLVLVA